MELYLPARAIHLEIAEDLTTDAFILALHCFITCWGNVKHIWSDNGTNFKEAQKELQDAITEINIPKVVSELVKKHVNFIWTFNPPSSHPIRWMGGAWEALIKSVKRTLKAIERDRLFTKETLHKFVCEVESILNNRPITPSSDDINDYEALNPNYILLGHSLSNHAPGVFRDNKINYRKKWCAVQAATNMFWSCWLKEYLPTLVQKRKWNYPTENLNVGDLVVIQTDNIPRSQWSLGRIIETYPGEDGVVWTVKVKTPSNKLLQPAQKLCLLEKANKQKLLSCQNIIRNLPHWGRRMLRQKYLCYTCFV